MDFSEMLFYGGIAGMAGTAVISVVVIVFMVGRKKKLQRKLDMEYGESH